MAILSIDNIEMVLVEYLSFQAIAKIDRFAINIIFILVVYKELFVVFLCRFSIIPYCKTV